MSYTLRHVAYCGMVTYEETFETRQEGLSTSAVYLREVRRHYPIDILEPGRKWEILEPDDNQGLVPDDCGVLTLHHVTYECREEDHFCDGLDDD